MERCLAVQGEGQARHQLAAYKTQLEAQLAQLSATLVADPLLQLKLKALILDLVHHIDVLNQLVGASEVVVCLS